MPAAETTFPLPTGQSRSLRSDYGRINLFSVAHATNDMYGNLLTSLMPYLVLQGKITTTVAGLILLVYLFCSSVLQPIFGLLADRSGRRLFAIAGPLWVGFGASMVGWVGSTGLLFALAAVSGIGSAAFHPQAASMVNQLSRRNKGWAMAIFSTGGNIGFAVGPILAAGIAVIGLHWSPVVIAPGILLTILLARYTPCVQRSRHQARISMLWAAFCETRRALSLVVAVIATRSATQYALIIFLPLYYHARGSSSELGSLYAFVLSLAGAFGGMLGGGLSDRYGRKLVIVASLLLAAPLLFLTLNVSGPIIWPLLAISGGCLLASNSPTVVQGQELLPGNTGVASGLTLGLAFGLSGVLTSTLTTFSDRIGVTEVVQIVPLLPVASAVFAILVPRPPAARA